MYMYAAFSVAVCVTANWRNSLKITVFINLKEAPESLAVCSESVAEFFRLSQVVIF